jgi:hypothetical protein
MTCYKLLDMNVICNHFIYRGALMGSTYMLITKDAINMLKILFHWKIKPTMDTTCMIVTKYKIFKCVMNCLLSHGVQGLVTCNTCVNTSELTNIIERWTKRLLK